MNDSIVFFIVSITLPTVYLSSDSRPHRLRDRNIFPQDSLLCLQSSFRPTTHLPYPVLRGDSVMFQNCFCSKYCFQQKYSLVRTSQEKELWNSPVSYIQSLNPIKASQSSYFSKSWTDVYGTCIVFDLSSPFRSKYLILHF